MLPTTTTNSYDRVTEAERALNALLVEQDIYPAQRADAVRAGDGKRIIDIERRHDDLPALITAARVALLHAQIARLEEEVSETQAELQPLAEANEAAREALKAAKETQETAFRRWANVREHLQGAQADLADRRRALAGLIGEASVNRGPLVRSMPHA